MIKTITYTTVCYLILSVLVLSQTACKKEKSDQISTPTATTSFDVNRIRDCHNNSNPYPSQINSNLEGTWVWVSSSCYWTQNKTTSADKQVVVLFKDAGNYQVFENGALESEGTWKLSQTANNTWNIITSTHSVYLNGYVFLCNDEVVFSSSYLDGCDYYFTRDN